MFRTRASTLYFQLQLLFVVLKLGASTLYLKFQPLLICKTELLFCTLKFQLFLIVFDLRSFYFALQLDLSLIVQTGASGSHLTLQPFNHFLDLRSCCFVLKLQTFIYVCLPSELLICTETLTFINVFDVRSFYSVLGLQVVTHRDFCFVLKASTLTIVLCA